MLLGAVSITVTAWGLLPALIVMGVGTGLFITYITSLTFFRHCRNREGRSTRRVPPVSKPGRFSRTGNFGHYSNCPGLCSHCRQHHRRTWPDHRYQRSSRRHSHITNRHSKPLPATNGMPYLPNCQRRFNPPWIQSSMPPLWRRCKLPWRLFWP